MAYYTEDLVLEKLDMWLEAESAVATGQSYKIGKRELTRAHLSEIRKQINFWEDKLNVINNKGKRIRPVRRMVPRDL